MIKKVNNQRIAKIAEKIKPILKKNKVKKAGIFGSYAKGDEKDKSDIDILIEIKDNLSITDLIKIKMKLEDKLKKKIDLIEYCCIHPLIKKVC